MRDAWRSIGLFSLVLLVPVIPFLLLGQRFEDRIVEQFQIDLPWSAVAALAAGSLAIDIFLPVPSSAVCTLAGDRLGIVGGTIVCWTGLTCGGLLGYCLAYRFGEPLVGRWIKPTQSLSTRRMYDRMGSLLVVFSRPVPIFAEATLLWMGVQGISGRVVVWPLALANLVLALGYTSLGTMAGRQDWLVTALVLSTALPVALWLVVMRYFRTVERNAVEHEPK